MRQTDTACARCMERETSVESLARGASTHVHHTCVCTRKRNKQRDVHSWEMRQDVGQRRFTLTDACCCFFKAHITTSTVPRLSVLTAKTFRNVADVLCRTLNHTTFFC